jgi:uncharacterized membrane protein (DUF106 family)|tara:strand:- start:615 stop:767 length:153 start_codon:yes stop_codon:yes gene_type:complete
MPAIQLERLKNDISELENYIKKLTKKGQIDRVSKLLEKKTFLEERLAAVI